MIETKTNDTTQTTKTTMDDANECAPLASAALARQIARASTPPSESHEQNKNPCNAACAHRWHAARSVYDAAPCDVKECMMYTRHCFYAAVPSNAAAYGPVEAIGAHEWSHIAHAWASFVSMSEANANETMQKTKSTMDDASECVPLAPAALARQGAGARTMPSTSHALSKTRTLPTPRWPGNPPPIDARHVATVGGPNRAIGRPSTTRITTCSCS